MIELVCTSVPVIEWMCSDVSISPVSKASDSVALLNVVSCKFKISCITCKNQLGYEQWWQRFKLQFYL